MKVFLTLGSTDFFNIVPVSVKIESDDKAMIELRTRNDAVTLEYDDSVLLLFTPDEDDLIGSLETTGIYMRDNVTVHIIDNDST